MNILIVNDDGIRAEGIKILAETAKHFGTVHVVAPTTEQSATSHGITILEPIEIVEDNTYFKDIFSYHISGKPADCVKIAKEHFKLDIDLVLSGVNNGPNIGTDIHYSGTIAGASEGSIHGIPSIAISTDFGCFDIVKNELTHVLKNILEKKIYTLSPILNINFPNKNYAASKGIKITNLGRRYYDVEYKHENGKYWSERSSVKPIIENEKDSDVKAFEEGFISITPLSINRLHYESYTTIKEIIQTL